MSTPARKRPEPTFKPEKAKEEAEVKTKTETETETETKTEVNETKTEPWSDDARATIASMIGARDKHAVPTLVTFRSGRLDRHVIVDVPEERLRRAWEWWLANVNGDAERFLGIVYAVLQCDVPRMYRAVGNLRLS